jgi:hypothetical protein
MPTVAEIERLSALVERLLPLSSRARGEPITAQDWNTIVGALLEVARATVQSGPTDHVPPHEHPDAVRSGWLDPVLRARLERGPFDDPAAVSRLGALERSLANIDHRLDATRADLGDVRAMATRVDTNDLSREAHLTSLGRKVDGLDDARVHVASLRDTLNSLRGELARVSAFAAGLEAAGQPVDVGALLTRLGAVEELRTRLTTPSGELLDAAAIERRQAELETKLVTEDELTAAIAASRAEIPDDVRTGLLEDARVAARDEAAAATAAVGAALQEQIRVRLPDIEAAAVRAATVRADEVGAGLRTSLRDELGALIAAGDDAVRETVTSSVAGSADALRAEIGARVDLVETALVAAVTTELDRRVPALIESLTRALDGLEARVVPIERGLEDVRGSSSATATDLVRLTAQVEATTGNVASTLRAELDAGLRGVRDEMAARQSALADALRAEIASDRLHVADELTAIRNQVPELVRDSVRGARDELVGVVHETVDKLRPELTKLIETGVIAEVKLRSGPTRPIG